MKSSSKLSRKAKIEFLKYYISTDKKMKNNVW